MPGRRAARGFQLLELAVVLSLMVTLSGWGVLATGRLLAEQRLQAARQSIVSAALLARSLAISRNTDMEVRTSPERHAFALVSRHSQSSVWQALPPGVRFTSVPSRPVTFHSRGSAAPAGSFTISNHQGTLRIIVAVSGRVRWSRQ